MKWKAVWSRVLIVGMVLSSVPAWAQEVWDKGEPVPTQIVTPPPPPAHPMQLSTDTRKSYNEKLGIAGALTILAGSLLVIPQGTTYTVFGEPLCVTDYSIDAGSCMPLQAKVGLITIGAGTLMTWIGFHKVRVSSVVTKQVKGVNATVVW